MKVSARGGIAGAIGGAFSGLASIYRDVGIDDDMMRRTAEDLSAGEVALFILYTGTWNRSSVVLQDALTARRHSLHRLEAAKPDARPDTACTGQSQCRIGFSARNCGRR